MNRPLPCKILIASWVVMGSLASGAGPARSAPRDVRSWTDEFHTADCRWASTGRNDYFILEPGHQDTYDGQEGKRAVHLEITVLNDTRIVNGVETRIVEERESHDGVLVEVSRNFFAICGPTNDVFYFGEDVDVYEHGKIANHEGSWTAGAHGAKPGLFMPARPLVGARFYQEIAPGEAMDRVEIVSDSETLRTPAGEFRGCVKIEETSPLEPEATDHKYFARGVGLVKDGSLPLTKSGTASTKSP